MTSVTARVRATAAWWVVAAAVRRDGIGARSLARIRAAIFAGAGAADVVREDRRQAAPTYVPGLAARPWHDPARFASAAALASARPRLRAEAERMYADGLFVPKPADRIARGQWSTCNLVYLGVPVAAHHGRCAASAAVVGGLADASSLGLTYLCALGPGAALTPHMGHTNAKLRLQVNLRADGAAALAVGGERRLCGDGACIVVDESFGTEEWNPGPEPRLALMVDVWHPDLRPEEIRALDVLMRVSRRARRGRRVAGAR